MRVALLFGIGAVTVVGVASAIYLRAGSPPEVTIASTPGGLASLKVDKVEFLSSGQFRVDHVLLKKPNGETHEGSTHGLEVFNQDRRELVSTFPWGIVKIGYAASNGALGLTINTTNTSDTETIQGIWYIPLTLRFPEKLKEYDGSTPLLVHNVGQVGFVKVSYGSGTLGIVSEEFEHPLMVGFPWALDRPKSMEFPLSVSTDRVHSFPDSYPTIDRPIAPKATDQYSIALRFGRPGTPDAKLTGDVYKRFAEAFPVQLNWPDRRPIGAIFLASGPQDWPANPRGWFNDARLNVMKPAGLEEFKQRLMNFADNAIGIMHDMNAQGAITWDIEGQEYRHATTYIGDPRMVEKLAPEMAGVVDDYFDRFRKAGLRTGVAIRPQLLVVETNKKAANQTTVADPTSLMIEKIAYAKKRWGVTMIYIDSNVNATDPNPLDVNIIQKVAAAFPDCLLIPEHSNLRYYAYTAPYAELRQQVFSTPEAVRAIYPKAFSVIYTADGPLDIYHDGLKASVKHGDALMYRTWFTDPQNEKVKMLYSSR
jgi:hypothetical protein